MTLQSPETQARSTGDERGEGRTGLARLLDTTVSLSPDQVQTLDGGVKEGEAFFDHYNNARLELAFSSFDREMRLAVYELLFLLHVNHPKLAHWKFGKKVWTTVRGVRKQVPEETIAELYVPGAPAGVQMIGMLHPSFRKEYESYVEGVFDLPPYGEEQPKVHPVVTIQSVGSIGTIGHKSKDSDLDLQVIYDLNPFSRDTEGWDDSVFKNAINNEHRWWIHHIRRKQKISVEALQDPALKRKLSKAAADRIIRAYPGLYRCLVEGDREFAATLLAQGADKTLKLQVLHEILNLMKRAEKLSLLGDLRKKEVLFKERVNRVQQYINDKFPEAEIYLFVYTVDWFRQGSYSSTLEFKESSGSAYEMILNYDTLMPGIQFTPMMPTHFAMPESINNDPLLFKRLSDYVRFGAIDLYDDVKHRLVDLGHTPDLETKYVAQHGGAIYWEAFKASSGNLPKAMLNLFRFEMLLDAHLIKTTIQIVKDPAWINSLVSSKVEKDMAKALAEAEAPRRDALSIIGGGKSHTPAVPADGQASSRTLTAEQQLEAMGNLRTGLPPWAVLEIEETFPSLQQDPWWLRYKALKIGFHEERGVSGIDREQRDRISKVIDLAFCLHVRISDVMQPKSGKRGEVHKTTYREKVLLEFLERAFPPGSPRRINLESLFAGGVRGLILFENEMRDLFQRSMQRVEEKMAAQGIRDHVGDKREVDLWLKFYLENFHPMANHVPRVIMKHLKVARNGIQIGYRPGEGWAFMSIQKQSLLEKSAQTTGRNVSYLPERVLLHEKSGFAMGIAHCILNGYFGALDKNTPEERLTTIELDDKKLNQGNNIHNEMAFIKQDQVNRLMKSIIEAFPYQAYDFTDILKTEREFKTVFVMVNLWQFGLVSIIYRDNLSTWYCDEFEVPDMFENALEISKDMHRLLRTRPFLDAMREFFTSKRIDPDTVDLRGWVNPNSLQADHTQSFHAKLKDMEEGVTLVDILRSLNRGTVGDMLDAFGEN